MIIFQLKKSSEEGGFGFTDEEISWLGMDYINIDKNLRRFSYSASLQVFATIFTCIIGGILGEYLGRKTVCSIGSPIFLASFLCVTFAPTMHLLFFGQVITSTGSFIWLVPPKKLQVWKT